MSTNLFHMPSPDPDPLYVFLATYGELCQIELHLSACIEAAEHADRRDGWEDVYNILFDAGDASLVLRVRDLLARIDRLFPAYYDPDSSYQDDVEAWMEAFRDAIVRVQDDYTRRMSHHITR